MGNERYQELFRTSGTTVVEDRAAVLERDKLKQELESVKNSANRSSAYLEAIFKKANISSFDLADGTQRVISWITTFQTQISGLMEELDGKEEELQTLRKQIAATAKSSPDDEVVGGGGG